MLNLIEYLLFFDRIVTLKLLIVKKKFCCNSIFNEIFRIPSIFVKFYHNFFLLTFASAQFSNEIQNVANKNKSG